LAYRVHIAVFGSGLGHAARMSIVAERLIEKGFEVCFSTFYDAVEYLRGRGFTCHYIPPLDVAWMGGGFSLRRTFGQTPTLLSSFTRQVRAEVNILERLEPNLVLSDSRLSAVMAAYLAGIPSITIVNQIRVMLPPRYRRWLLRRIEGVTAEVLGLLWSLSEAILLPDLPPPYTISEENIRGARTVKSKVRYIGFLTQRHQMEAEDLHRVSDMLQLDGRRPVVFAQISGPKETRDALIGALLKAAEALTDRFTFIVSKGIPGGEEAPKRIKGGWLFEWCPVKDELFTLADCLVVRGGHSTLSQALASGRPIVSIPIPNHSEQIGNSKKIAELGVGLYLDPSSANPKRIASAIMEVCGVEAFKRRAVEVRDVTLRLDGLKAVVDAVEALL